MRLAGINIIGNDHSICVWDSASNEFFAISLERITRIKHDNKGLDQIKKYHPELFQNIDIVCIGSRGDNSETISMNNQLVTGLDFKNFIYETFEPKFIRDEKLIYNKLFTNLIKFGIYSFVKALWYLVKIKFSKKKNSHNDVTVYLKRFFKDCENFLYYEHHLSHCASAYFFSPYFQDKGVLVVSLDGFGDGSFSRAYLSSEMGDLNLLRDSKTWIIPRSTTSFNVFSLGILYANFTEAMGLQVNSEEGKVEAQAAFGSYDNYLYEMLHEVVKVKNGEIFGLTGVEKFYDLKWLQSNIGKLGKENFCSVIQQFLNDIVTEYGKQLKEISGADTICLSGGVVANVISNMSLFDADLFSNIFVVPAMADDGTSIGALALGAKKSGLQVGNSDLFSMPYWGSSISQDEIKSALTNFKNSVGFSHEINWQENVSDRLKMGQIGAIVRGRMEFGPRALGNRSIIASPIFDDMADRINAHIKKRPKYQPFCPSCLEEERARLFESSYSNKHMTAAFKIRQEFVDQIPSACHIDLTARPQFVSNDTNPDFHKLLMYMREKTGFGILINTSFNKHGRTIVRTANDAILDFIDCQLDFMVLGDFLVTRVDS